MNQHLSLFIKGLAMGAANVIPGVSGGTVALITGIYERLINAIKSFDIEAIKLLGKFDIKGLFQKVDGGFLAAVLGGVAVSIVSLAKVLEYALEYFEMYTMAFFFGLILLSILYVGKKVRNWSISSILMLLLGTAIAAGIALLAPASENASFLYVFICGIVAICSMILPGLSGSFILIIMGNYALVLGAISSFNMSLLIPLGLGCVFGLIAFSHLISWIFDRYYDQTIALMTGFILGSLAIIWPWKDTQTERLIREEGEKIVVVGYDWFLPEMALSSTWIAVGLIVVGAICIWLTERFGGEGEEVRSEK